MAEGKSSANSTEKLTPPDWLNAAFVQEALRRGGEPNLRVKQVTVRPATSPGDNYASTMFRVTAATTDGENRSVVVKAAPGDAGFTQMICEFGLFNTETAMFYRVVPHMEALLKAAAPGRFPPLTARGLHHGSDPLFLALEDLAPQGFKMADRHKGLGLRHSLVALRALARFHAATVALLQRDPKALQCARNPFKDKFKALEILSIGSLQATANGCRRWPGHEEYVVSLEALEPTILKKYGELNEPKLNTFNVINHGDFWTNNMLFQYKDGLPHEIRLVDLQLSRVGPAAIDLLYFLSTSLTEEVSTHHQDLLLREYHHALVEAMELLGLEPPTFEKILADVQSHGAYSLFGALGILPFVKAKNIPTVEAVLSGHEAATVALYEDPAVKRWLQRLLSEYKRKGWLSV